MIPSRITRLVHLFSRLPGVGEKTAQRFALTMTSNPELAESLGSSLQQLVQFVRPCDVCGNIAEVDEQNAAVCAVCSDSRRSSTLLCIVARVQDLIAVERSGAMRGRYFVLGKLLSPLDGIGPEALPLDRLRSRIKSDGVTEVIVATPTSVDGEATALYLARELEALSISVTRIASGMPHGGDLEFADQITLGRAIDGRRSL
jgi:recombination protein RecR